MKSVTIELINGYFIEVDELNHTLKQRYQGETKDGEKKPAERIIGYYPSVKACVERIVKLIPLDENDCKVISMREYVDEVEKAFKRVSEAEVVGGVDMKKNGAMELKPCPFCGSAKLKIDKKSTLYGYNGLDMRAERHTYSVRCNVCHARGGAIGGLVIVDRRATKVHDKFTTDDELKEKVISAWNRRANDGKTD